MAGGRATGRGGRRPGGAGGDKRRRAGSQPWLHQCSARVRLGEHPYFPACLTLTCLAPSSSPPLLRSAAPAGLHQAGPGAHHGCWRHCQDRRHVAGGPAGERGLRPAQDHVRAAPGGTPPPPPPRSRRRQRRQRAPRERPARAGGCCRAACRRLLTHAAGAAGAIAPHSTRRHVSPPFHCSPEPNLTPSSPHSASAAAAPLSVAPRSPARPPWPPFLIRGTPLFCSVDFSHSNQMSGQGTSWRQLRVAGQQRQE